MFVYIGKKFIWPEIRDKTQCLLHSNANWKINIEQLLKVRHERSKHCVPTSNEVFSTHRLIRYLFRRPIFPIITAKCSNPVIPSSLLKRSFTFRYTVKWKVSLLSSFPICAANSTARIRHFFDNFEEDTRTIKRNTSTIWMDECKQAECFALQYARASDVADAFVNIGKGSIFIKCTA